MKDFLILLGCFSLMGCHGSAVSRLPLSDGGQAYYTIKKIKVNDGYYFVFGEVYAEFDSKEIDYVDLNCFQLGYGGVASLNTYVDSMAYVLENKYPVRNGRVAADVYWIFKDKVMDKKGFSLFYKQKSGGDGSCIIKSKDTR